MRWLVLLFAAASLGFAPIPFLKPGKGASPEAEMRALEGEWQRVSLTIDGKAVGHHRGCTLVIGEYGMSLCWLCNVDKVSGSLTLSPSASSPRAFDLTIPAKRNVLDFVMQGIYRVDGDTLTLCISHVAGPRPATFDDRAGVSVHV